MTEHDTPDARHADNEQGVQQLAPDVTPVVDRAAAQRARYDAGERRVPPGADMLDDLTVTELDVASRQLRCDVIEAVGGKDGLRWAALPRVAWLWAKRRDPQAKLAPYLELSPSRLGALLGLDDDDDDQVPDDETNPMDPARE